MRKHADNKENSRTILAFDFGVKNIGVAVGQTVTQTATELAPLKASNGIPNKAALIQLVEEWLPDYFVVGIPLNMDGTEMEMTHRARKFANRLKASFNREWFAADERLSTREAKEIARKKGQKKTYKQNPVDSLAAKIILEDWMGDPNNIKINCGGSHLI